MTARILLTLVLALAVAAVAYPACDDDDDDQTGARPTPSPGSCVENTAPLLSEMVLLPEGREEAAASPFMEATLTRVYLSYQDNECNLGGGKIYMGLDGAEPEEAAIANANAPCAAQAGEQRVGFEFTPFLPGDHQLAVYVIDLCGAQSNTITTQFTLTPWEETGDDDTAVVGPDDDTGDDDTVEATALAGSVTYTGGDDLAGRPVLVLLYLEWLPEVLLTPVSFTSFTVPDAGFPFTYQWNLDEAEVDAGVYYVAAYANHTLGDGMFNPEIDPVHSPFLPTVIMAGKVNTQNLTLVPPGK